ncbi:LLM class F420-dependent oxidoreductase [Saccharopolyspora gloriosae]|uniref:Putative F420-dependent oxidoreductase n=1 Tax=Saccharopolyspora gloriosae TaxID=455344 RepID=A0A840NL30_9PSEU|nr:TIGR03619 family F420-dependent LLM class oxidoreductase [Saccharopolyspora gloriosae]MBB5070833.1 putative F420-dependent oxidoreductase [Saccharopolyspora gloriosae]
MRLGLGLPQFGTFAHPDHVRTVAAEAEAMGFDGLWAGERVHAPYELLTPYPGGDGTMPAQMRAGLDPLLTLSIAATATTLPRLGTSTLSAPLHSPIQLARGLTGLDLLSSGRLIAGLGLSWSRDEYNAAGVPWTERGARLDETLDVLNAAWGPDPIEHRGRFWTISAGDFQPKPQGKIPVYLGGGSDAALRRIARRADGWLAIALPLDALGRMLRALREHPRDPGLPPVRTVLRVNPELGPPGSRPVQGPVEQIVDYLHAAAELGVEEAFIDLQFTCTTVPELLDNAARFHSTFTT